MKKKIFENGWVYTEVGDFERASLVVSDNQIQAIVGPGMPLPDDIGDDVERVDLGRGFVLPGFVDTHIHLTAVALNKLRCDLSGSESARDACELLAAWSEDHPDAPFVMGVDFDESRWEQAAHPTRTMLDGVNAEKPVLARRICGHIGVVNSILLDRLPKRPDLIDDESGTVAEHALWDAGRFWSPQPERVITSIEAAIRDLHKLGITTIHDIVEPENFETYAKGVAASSVPLRIDVLLHSTPRHIEYYRRTCEESGAKDLRLVGLKSFLDGSLGGRTAALNADYADGHGWGTLLMRKEVIRALGEECSENGYVLAIHAIGDRAIDQAASVFKGFPGDTHLFRLEHCEVAGPTQIKNLENAPVFVSLQPNYVRNWGGPGGLNERRLGKERNRWCNPYRSFIDAGIECVFGSDGMPAGPLFGMKGAIEHPVEEERLTPQLAIGCYTSRPHALRAHERNAGVLEPGRLADFVVLSGNPLGEDLDTVGVRKTILDGEIVYDTDVGEETAPDTDAPE